MHLLSKLAALLISTGLAVALAGCEGGDSSGNGNSHTTTISSSPSPIEDDGRFFVIDEVGFGPDGYVSLTNFTEAQGSLAGLFVCQPPKCAALPDADVSPGKTVLLAVGGGENLDRVVASDLRLGLSPDDGEVGLYASTDVEEPLDVRAYVEWGSTPHEGTPVAVEAGLWLEGSFVESSENATRIYRTEGGEWEFDIATGGE